MSIVKNFKTKKVAVNGAVGGVQKSSLDGMQQKPCNILQNNKRFIFSIVKLEFHKSLPRGIVHLLTNWNRVKEDC
jgi:hypothetical protein